VLEAIALLGDTGSELDVIFADEDVGIAVISGGRALFGHL
jgi:hypothetical protein